MKKFFAIALLAALLGLLVIAAAIWKSASEQKRLMATLKAKGYPTTMAELDPPVEHLPAEENGSLYFESAAEALQAPAEALPELPEDSAEPLPEEQVRSIEAWLGQNKEALDLLYKGAALEKGRYNFSLAAGPAQALPFGSKQRSLSQLLELEAVFRAEQGDAEGAVKAIQASLRVGDSLAAYPIVLLQLVRNACYNYALAALDRCLVRATFTDDQLVRLSASLAASRQVAEPATARALSGEMVYGATMSPGLWGSRYRNSLSRMALAADAPPQERMAKVKAAVPTGPAVLNPAVLTAPALTRAVEADLGGLAELQAAETCLALERYRLAQGSLPEALDALVPMYLKAVPLDPFDGQPLRYKRDEKGCVVYSVGPDGKDENGAPRRHERGDESFRLHR